MAGARVVLLGMDVPTSYGSDYTAAFSDMYGRLAADTDVTYVAGFVREVGLDPSLMQPDGLHPTAEGHSALAERLIPTLASVVEELDGG